MWLHLSACFKVPPLVVKSEGLYSNIILPFVSISQAAPSEIKHTFLPADMQRKFFNYFFSLEGYMLTECMLNYCSLLHPHES